MMNNSCAELKNNDLFRIFFLLIIAIISVGSVSVKYLTSKDTYDDDAAAFNIDGAIGAE